MIPMFTKYLSRKPLDVEGLVAQEIDSAEREERIRSLEAQVDRLTQLLGYAVSTLSYDQQRRFADAAGWENQP